MCWLLLLCTKARQNCLFSAPKEIKPEAVYLLGDGDMRTDDALFPAAYFRFLLVNVLHGGGLYRAKYSDLKRLGSLTLVNFLRCLLAKSATNYHISKQLHLHARDMEGRMFCIKKRSSQYQVSILQ